jgi:hypothetical protein
MSRYTRLILIVIAIAIAVLIVGRLTYGAGVFVGAR